MHRFLFLFNQELHFEVFPRARCQSQAWVELSAELDGGVHGGPDPFGALAY